MSAFAAKIARLASAEGEEDADILRHHRAHLLLAEAAAILRAGSSASHRAQAAEKMATAFSGGLNADFRDLVDDFIRAYTSRSFAADAADVGAPAAAFVDYIDAIASMLLVDAHIEDRRRARADQIMKLLDEIRAAPEAVNESLRRLGTTLTTARLEFFSLERLVDTARLGDPVFSQSPALARRQAFLCAACPGTAG